MSATSEATFSEFLLVPSGLVDLSDYDPRDKKKDGKKALERHKDELDNLQEELFAHGYSGGERRLLS